MLTYIAPNTMIGKHVQAMPMCVIGHDVVIKDYVTLCPPASYLATLFCRRRIDHR